MVRFALARIAGALIILGCGLSASAEAGIIINFSSSDNFGENPANLNAKVTFTQVNNVGPGGTLTIQIENTSNPLVLPDFNLADLFFNAANAGTFTVTSVSTNQPSGGPSLGGTTIQGNGSPSQNADGYGDFGYNLDWGVNQASRLDEGYTATFVATYTGSISDADLKATVAASPGDGRSGPNIAVLHFYDVNKKNNTGFGGSGDGSTVTITATTPEPSTLCGAGIAALMGIGYGWRRRGKSAA